MPISSGMWKSAKINRRNESALYNGAVIRSHMAHSMSVKIKNPREIIDDQALAATLGENVRTEESPKERRQKTLELLKSALIQGVDEVRRRFDVHGKGDFVVYDNSYLIDQIIRVLYEYAVERERDGLIGLDDMAIVAVGGYGRGELSPKSDIDLLFLLKPKSNPEIEKLVEYVLYMLWDLGLKVGHSTRSVDECIRQAKADMTIRTSLLEKRCLAGDQDLFAELGRRYRSDVAAGTEVKFVEAKLAERDERHAKLGEARYVLEPNIKEGKGGLRDLHTLNWIGEYLFDIKSARELLEKGIISLDASKRFAKAQSFLWTARAHLHYLTGREEDRLTFDVQREIAWRMGYADRGATLGVERFMKHYFLIAKDVGDLTRIFCALLEARGQRKVRSLFPIFHRQRKIDGFSLIGDRLDVEKEEDFAENPVQMIRLFHTALFHGLDIHPHALSLITQNLGLIGDKLRNDPEANRLFIEILTAPKDPESTLRHMNEADVLGRFIPDFGRVVAQMQYDMYHVYTVDEHTIHAIGVLHRLVSGAYKVEMPLMSSLIGNDITAWRTLYVATFLHDIAKGRNGDHSELGAEIALKLGRRFGLSPAETETVSWLVHHHLLMTHIAFRRDMEDRQTIDDFVSVVQSPERLKLLLALTVADIRAVGPNVWSAWKAGLLRDLYIQSRNKMLGGGETEPRAKQVLNAQNALRGRLQGQWSEAEIDAYVTRGYPAYWVSSDSDAHYRHALMIRKAEESGCKLYIDVEDDVRLGVLEVTVYTADHAGLFAGIAGAMALAGASIVDAKITTMSDGMALDSFFILDFNGERFDVKNNVTRLRDTIEQVVTGRLTVPREIAKRRESGLAKARMFSVEPLVSINNALSSTHTVLEINGRNRTGLLYDITAMMTDLSLSISSAHISTFGEKAVDVFYIKDLFGMKVTHDRKIKEIQERLLSVLIDPDGAEQKAERPRRAIRSKKRN